MAEFEPLIPIEEGNETSWYAATAAGIASGIIKIPEGVVSLAAELIDLGADTNTAAEVEKFFDKINPFEEIAEDRAAGVLTEALISIGVPASAGFKLGTKLARKALKAKGLGTYASPKSKPLMESSAKAKSLNDKLGRTQFISGTVGGAVGESFVADVEKIGTFGDLFSGPTELDRDDTLEGRPDAIRKLLNRLKFSSEGLFVTPIVAGVGKGAKALATQGEKLALSDSSFYRWIDKNVGGLLRPRENLPYNVWKSEMLKQSLKAKDIDIAKNIVDDFTKTIKKIFPETQNVMDKTNSSGREEFLKRIDELLFEGDLSKPVAGNKIDDLVKDLKLKNISKDSQQKIINSLDEARYLINDLELNLSKYLPTKDTKQMGELKNILKNRAKDFIGSTYKIFEHKSSIFNFFRGYKPTDESYTNAVNFFENYLYKNDTTKKIGTPFKPGDYQQQARSIVDDIIYRAEKAKRPSPISDFSYVNKTVEGEPNAIIKGFLGQENKVLKELFGEIKDPRYSIFQAVTNLSSVARTSGFMEDVFNQNKKIVSDAKNAIVKGETPDNVGWFWDGLDEAKQAVKQSETGIELVRVDKVFQEILDNNSLIPGSKNNIVNPFQSEKGFYTTKEIAESLKNFNDIASGLTGFVRGRETAGPGEKAASFLYRNLLLIPKAASQLAKTVLSIPTHIRNMLSATGFTIANGGLFENPKVLKEVFGDALNISGLFKGDKSKEAVKAYQDLIELGVVNSQVQIGDLKALLKDTKLGANILDVDKSINPLLNKLKRLKDWAQGKYVAEDDTFKIANFGIELDRLKKVKAKELKIDIKELNKRLSVEGAERNQLLWSLKQEAADIVKNTVPNYAYVGSAVKASRLLPIGNFASFPSEMIRTSTNIVEQSFKEMKHSKKVIGSDIAPWVYEVGKGFVKNDNLKWSIGAKRLSGMAAYTAVMPPLLVEGMKSLHNVTTEELEALREFVPDWSKNSTLLPIRDEEGELRYIDFSHSNAYDTLSRPFRTVFNEVMKGKQNSGTLLSGFVNGATQASAEIMNPFIEESIWTEAMVDLTIRGGRTPEGRLLYTDQTSAGDKLAIKFLHLADALAPSYKQYQRLIQAASETPTKRGEMLDVGPEIAGFMGLRPIKVNPLDAMGFKISEYQEGIRNSRREFTGGYFGLLRGGQIEPNDIIERFYKSNRAKFEVQRKMATTLKAAETLGVQNNKLIREFKDRQLSGITFNNLKKNKFEPYFPSEDIQLRFAEIAKDLGVPNPFREVAPVLRQMLRDFRGINLSEPFGIGVGQYLLEDVSLPTQIIEGLTPDPNVITSGQSVINSGQALAQGVTPSGLTPTEEALLSDEEKLIRRRQRGLA